MSGTASAWGDTSRAPAREAVISAFGDRVPVSYCAKRTSADFSGKPSSIPRCFCVIPRMMRKKRIRSPIAIISCPISFVAAASIAD